MTESDPRSAGSIPAHGVRTSGGTGIAASVLALLGAARRLVGAIVAIGVFAVLGDDMMRATEAPNRTILLISIPILLAIGTALLVGGIQLLRKRLAARTLIVTACSVDIAYAVIEFVAVKALASSLDMIAVGSPALLISAVIFPIITIALTMNSSTARWLDHGSAGFGQPTSEPSPVQCRQDGPSQSLNLAASRSDGQRNQLGAETALSGRTDATGGAGRNLARARTDAAATAAGSVAGQSSTMNSLAVIAVVLGVVIAPLAIPFGHIARSQIKKTGERGSGMALAGLVLGYLSLLVIVILVAAGLGAVRSGDGVAAQFTSTPTTTAATATDITTWRPQEKKVADRFPGLVSAAPNGTGYMGSVCTTGTTSTSPSGDIQCSGPASYLNSNAVCLPTESFAYPDYPETSAGKTGNFRTENWQRPSGTGHVWIGDLWVGGDHGQTGWVYIYFDQKPRATCMVYVAWSDHTGADIMNQWWPSAPL
jgi:hypothetical protein